MDNQPEQKQQRIQNKKRKFVADGVFYAELHEFLTREVGSLTYAKVDVRVSPLKTEIVLHATSPLSVIGGKSKQKLRELTYLIKQRFGFESVRLFAKRIPRRAFSAVAQAEAIVYRLKTGTAVRRACYSVLRYIMKEAKGVEIAVSGKLRAARAKTMKFKSGFMIKSGTAAKQYLETAVRHIKMPQGVLGVRVTIMLPFDPTGITGPSEKLPDDFEIFDAPKQVKIDKPYAIDIEHNTNNQQQGNDKQQDKKPVQQQQQQQQQA